MSDETMHLRDLLPDSKNRRKHTPRNVGMIAEAMQRHGFARSIVIDEQNRLLAGSGAVEGAAQVGIERVHVVEGDGNTVIAVRRRGLSEAQKRDLAIADNRTAELAEWDLDQLRADIEAGLDLSTYFAPMELDALFAAPVEIEGDREEQRREAHKRLADRFLVPPFTVLNAREGWWQARKAAWIALGIRSELGRVDTPPGGGGPNSVMRDPKYKAGSERVASFKAQARLTALQKTGSSKVTR